MNQALATGLKHLASAAGDAFKVLNRIEYSAPWTSQEKRARHG